MPKRAVRSAGAARAGGGRAKWARAKTRWRTATAPVTFPEAVREDEEVVPVDAVSTWVLPSGVTVGRQVVRERRCERTPERHDHAIHFRTAPRRRRRGTRIHPRRDPRHPVDA
ncbi:hypothetical protein FGF04_30210 [Streptomyces apricus]|uniref:Uncharacterized protein n=1 Tax=Streptomyces apricus TaxID=1828112 RepID=A0A5B0ALA0_9ACTN|nr:hypothetical protein FGF04_30210 [Streptomyces apricus]